MVLLQASLPCPPHPQHKPHLGTCSRKLSHFLPGNLVYQALQVVVIWGHCCGRFDRGLHVKPSTNCPIQCFRLFPLWLTQPRLPIAHPFQWAAQRVGPCSNTLSKGPRDRANGKSHLFFVCYHSNMKHHLLLPERSPLQGTLRNLQEIKFWKSKYGKLRL